MTEILIVDDEQPVRRLLRRYLEAAGYGCREAADVGAAKSLLKTHAVDLILSDITMPDESGIDLVHHVAEDYPQTPVVMVSVIDDPALAKEALEMGVYGYIVKPFTRNIVLITVYNALQRSRLEKGKRAYMEDLEFQVRERTETLQNQLTFMQDLLDAMPSPVFYKDKTGKFKGVNRAFEDMANLPGESIIGKRMVDILPEDIAGIADIVGVADDTDRQLLLSSGKLVYENIAIHPDQTVRNFLVNKASYHDARGEIAGLVGVMVDITRQKAAEEALRLSEEKFRRIVENVGFGVAMIGPTMEVLWTNRVMTEWFPGFDHDERPTCFHAFISPSRDTPCNNCPVTRALKEGKRFEAAPSDLALHKQRNYRIIASPIHDKEGKVIAAIELVEDITEKLTMERDLRQAQKLESIGQLAAGIAHEINTPTQYIGDNIRFIEEATNDLLSVLAAYETLLESAKRGDALDGHIAAVEQRMESADIGYLRDEIPQAIEQTMEGVSRVSKIVTSMRQFSHPGSGKKSAVDINQAIEATITVARNEWKYVADMETDFDERLPLVDCLPGEINQVILNLLVNAAHAIGDTSDNGKNGKGKIRIATRLDHDWARISIADTGGGIPEPIHQRIFDPFFTTKPVGKGTGQGLAIAHRVITEMHGGTIDFETKENHGTTFTVKLPLKAASAPDQEGNTPSARYEVEGLK